MPPFTPNQELLRMQLAQARALQQPSGRSWGAGVGGVLGTLGDVLRTAGGASQEAAMAKALRGDVEKTAAAQEATRLAQEDPMSAPSQRARETLQAFGGDLIQGVDLSKLTASQLEPATGLLKTRAQIRIEEERRKAQAEQAQQQLELQKLILAANQGDKRAQRALDLMELQLRERLGQQQLDVAKLGATTRQGEGIEKSIEETSKRLEGVQPLFQDLETLTKFSQLPDVPGIGQTGRVPDMFLSEEGKRVRQAARGLIGTWLKERSGTAASDAEVERVMGELGMGQNATDESFRLGLARATEGLRATLRTKEAGAKPEALKELRRRGVLTSQDLPRLGGGMGAGIGAQPPAEAAPAAGAPTPDLATRIAQLKAQGLGQAAIMAQVKEEGLVPP